MVDVKFDIIPTKEGRANLKVSINEGKKISIKKIIFEGNVKVKDGDLKGEMKDTKEKKWWMFLNSNQKINPVTNLIFNFNADLFKNP